jgi:hypothetical protein
MKQFKWDTHLQVLCKVVVVICCCGEDKKNEAAMVAKRSCNGVQLLTLNAQVRCCNELCSSLTRDCGN